MEVIGTFKADMRYSNETGFKVVCRIQIKTSLFIRIACAEFLSCGILENKFVDVIESKQSLHVSFKSEFIKIG